MEGHPGPAVGVVGAASSRHCRSPSEQKLQPRIVTAHWQVSPMVSQNFRYPGPVVYFVSDFVKFSSTESTALDAIVEMLAP